VFDTLSDKLQHALGDLRGKGRLDEEAISKAMREIRLALLEADVNFQVVKDFVAQVRERATGQDVLKGLDAGQQVVKIVHEELTALMGSGDSRLAFGKPPTVILLAGLQGSGKTTTSAKLALKLRKDGKKPALIAADLQRPAAIDQLEQLGRQIQIPVHRRETKDPVEVVKSGLQAARDAGNDVVIVDTAGRLHVDEELMEELARVRDAARPTNVLLVLDAMTGQEAVNVAQAFQERVAFDGVVLTKLDGDARGGAALSVRQVTGKPILFVGVGEKTEALEPFHPERIASRILGMGDVVSLIEQVQATADQEKTAKLAAKLSKGQGFDLTDLREQLSEFNRMGGIQALAAKLPNQALPPGALAQVDDRAIRRQLGIIDSMTPDERRRPAIIAASRKRRIAAGAGVPVQDVNRLLKQFMQMEKVMKKMKGGGLRKLMRSLSGQFPGGFGPR
jgi:signal recognition particle subunit SRP54